MSLCFEINICKIYGALVLKFDYFKNSVSIQASTASIKSKKYWGNSFLL